MEKIKAFHKIIDELCYENKIEQKKISYGWIRELKKDNIVRNIIKYQFDLNTAVSCNIANDKFATYEVLKANSIPTIMHKMIFNSRTRSQYFDENYLDTVKELLEDNNNKIVIKANDSCEGKDVYFCSNEQEINATIKKLFSENKDSLSACPFKEIEYEYRVIYLDGEVLYTYKKRKPYIVGDGVSKIKDLINKKYSNIKLDYMKNLNLDAILKSGECYEISWKHNLNGGAEPILIDESDKYIDKVKEIAVEAGKALNISFASIDIAQTKDMELLVMEINASVCMNKFSDMMPNGYEIAKAIYSKALLKMFKQK